MARIDLERHAVIEASAGTGKTHTIVEDLAVPLLEQGVPLDRLVLVTFTEKAAGEMKGRLRQTLETELRAEQDRQSAAGTRQQRLQAALDSFEQANISTIHGFCQRVLQDYAFDNRQDFHAELAHDADLLGGCLREIQRRQWRQEYGDRLPLILDLAGFTRRGGNVAWERVVCQLAQRYRPGCGHQLRPEVQDNWLAGIARFEADLRQALPELRRLAGEPLRLDAIEENPWYAGFDRVSLNPTWREARRAVVLVPLLRWLADPASGEHLIPSFRRLLSECRGLKSFAEHGFTLLCDDLPQAELTRWCPNLAAVAGQLEQLRSASAGLELTEQLMVRTVHQLQQQLAAHKQERGLHSFEDLLVRVDDALDEQKNPRAAGLLASLRSRYCCAIVDEFQDTDPMQWRIFRKIFVEAGTSHRLFVVGDPKQAIFGFRGADVHAFFQARNELKERFHAQELPLDVNWRSSGLLLGALNQLFERGGWFEGTSIAYRPVQAAEEASPNRVLVDRTRRPDLSIVDLTRPAGALKRARRRMARFIVAEIQRLLTPVGGKSALEFECKGQRRDLCGSDFAILVGKRSEAGPVIDELREANIPYTFYKQPGLWQSAEAVHLGYVLRALARPGDPASFRKVLLTRFYRIRPEELSRCPELPSRHEVRMLFEKWCELAAERCWAELFASLLEETGVLFHDPAAPDAERTLANFRHIFQTLQQAAYAHDLDLFGVLEELAGLGRRFHDNEGDVQPIETERPKVHIQTIHSSKGLEYPVVFIAGGFTRGLPPEWQTYRDRRDGHLIYDLSADPSGEALAQQERASEERRLLYVALTRAMFKLYVPLLDTERNFSSAGPAVTVLAPALIQSGLTRQETDQVRTIRSAGPASAWTQPSGARASTLVAPSPISLAAGLFPQLDPHLAQRRTTIKSFTSLRRSLAPAATVRPGFPEPLQRADDDVGDVLDDQPVLRGPGFGELVHAALQQIDFAAVARAEGPAALLEPRSSTRELIDKQIEAYLVEQPARGGDEVDACRQLVARLVWDALHTPLAALQGPLALVPSEDRLHELAFDFPESEGPALPGTRRQEGFLTGVIDLVVRKSGRLFLVDWKTNLLPGGYSPEAIKHNMEECDYIRQYRLYLQALARWLRRVLGRPVDPACDFGGVYYLYLRGMNGRDESAGVFSTRPTALDLQLQGVLEE